MEICGDMYPNGLIDCMRNGTIKVIASIRRCGEAHPLLIFFESYLRNEVGVDDGHIVEVALDDEGNARLRDSSVLNDFLGFRIADKNLPIMFCLMRCSMPFRTKSSKAMPPRLYGALNGLLRMRNVDVYVAGSNSRLLSSDVMTQFRGRGDEVRVRPLSFSEFMQGFEGDKYEGWAEYVAYGGMPLTNPPKIEVTFKSVLKSKISTNTISSYIGHLEESFLIEEARRYDVKGRKSFA